VGAWKIALYFPGWKHAGQKLAEVWKLRERELPAPIRMCDALSRKLVAGTPISYMNGSRSILQQFRPRMFLSHLKVYSLMRNTNHGRPMT